MDDTLIDTSRTILPVKFKRALLEIQKKGAFALARPLSNTENFQVENLRLKKNTGLNFNLKKALKILIDIDKRCSSSKKALKFFFAKYGIPSSPYLTLAKQAVYQSRLDGIDIKPVPYALLILKYLFDKHSLVLVTAGEEKLQKEKLKKAGIDFSFFSKIEVVKVKTGSKKKSYDRICKSLKFEPDQVLVVGDRIDADLRPAKELGFKTVLMLRGRGLVQKAGYQKIDFQITSLLELKTIVKTNF